jgi:hypothetical protein
MGPDWVMHVQVDIAPVKLTVDPGLVTQLLDYVQQVRQVVHTTLPPAHNPLQNARTLKQVRWQCLVLGRQLCEAGLCLFCKS